MDKFLPVTFRTYNVDNQKVLSLLPGQIIQSPIFILIFSCLWADNSKSIPRKGLYLLLIIGLLTQSMDALIVYMAIAPLSAFASWAKRSVKSKHRFKIEQKVKV